MQLWQYCLLVTAKLLYMFRTLSALSSGVLTTVEAATGAFHESGRYTGCPGRNVPDFGIMFLKLIYTDITQNTYILS